MSRFLRTGTVSALLRSMQVSIDALRKSVTVWATNVLMLLGLIVHSACAPADAQWVGPVPESADVAEPERGPEATVLGGDPLLPGDLEGIDDEQLRYLRNTIFARHGCDFGNKTLAEYFGAKPWYAIDLEYTKERLTLVDQQNIQVLLKAEGDWEAARTQGQVVVIQQSDEASETAGGLEVLDAYLTDKEAVANGTAPEGFELPALDFYKETGVKKPLTQVPQDDHGEAEPLEE